MPQGSFEIGGADHVENDIDALAAGFGFNDLGEILLAVIDPALGAELHAGLAFFRRARRGIDFGAKGFRKLDGSRADTAGAAVDEHAFPFGKACHLEEIGPDSEEGFRQCGRFDGVVTFGKGIRPAGTVQYSA